MVAGKTNKVTICLGILFAAMYILAFSGCTSIGQIPKDNQDKRPKENNQFTQSFIVRKSDFISTGRNPFFILEPNYSLSFEGTEEGKKASLVIAVLDETRMVDGVETRIVEEHHTLDGELVEFSRNYFAIDKRTNSVFYFGEDVDIYENGKVVGHEGAWLSGNNNAKFGLIMPGINLLGARYFQEIAPDVAMDRAETISVSETADTPAGEFNNVLKTLETTPLEPGHEEFKYYAPGIGLIKDADLELVRHEFK